MVRTDRIEPDAEVVARLGAVALALPEAYEEDAWTGVRWRIRAKTFGHVMVAQAGFASHPSVMSRASLTRPPF
jgi:hypothetical protein